jgi:hypothetical protein
MKRLYYFMVHVVERDGLTPPFTPLSGVPRVYFAFLSEIDPGISPEWS